MAFSGLLFLHSSRFLFQILTYSVRTMYCASIQNIDDKGTVSRRWIEDGVQLSLHNIYVCMADQSSYFFLIHEGVFIPLTTEMHVSAFCSEETAAKED